MGVIINTPPKKFPTPDYESRTRVYSGSIGTTETTLYTAPDDCYVQIVTESTGSTGQRAAYYVNGTWTVAGYNGSSVYIIPIKKGDVLTAQRNSTSASCEVYRMNIRY